ncbi:MAG: helix-turn-helix domain-containing protein [Leptolyngbya sp. SIO3F4]|nr:helix-turn-helix domain-containing protein [Leptolyngbya sp. SIO3F4]
MTTFRVAHTNRFTRIKNEAIQDKRLSLKARGLHCILLSYPDDWKINLSHLVEQSDKDGRSSVSAAIQELEELGYLSKRQERRENGTFGQIFYDVYELPPSSDTCRDTTTLHTDKPHTEKSIADKPLTDKPHTEKPLTDKPIADKPLTENRSHIKTYNNQDFSNQDFSSPLPPSIKDFALKEERKKESGSLGSTSLPTGQAQVFGQYQSENSSVPSAVSYGHFGVRYQGSPEFLEERPWIEQWRNVNPRYHEKFMFWCLPKLAKFDSYKFGANIADVKRYLSKGNYDTPESNERATSVAAWWDEYQESTKPRPRLIYEVIDSEMDLLLRGDIPA